MPSASPPADAIVPPIRSASRQLVREWGFLRPTVAGTSLSASAVHALIEIGEHGARSVPELCGTLRIDTTAARGAVQELRTAGHLAPQETSNATDALVLTPHGVETLAAINAHASSQVHKALQMLAPEDSAVVLKGLQAYASALLQSAPPAGDSAATRADEIRIVAGYRPGMLGKTLELHARYYARVSGFGKLFETYLAVEGGSLVERLDNPINEAWAAVRGDDDEIVGTLFVDGEDDKGPQMRFFIVDDAIRGRGIGRQLLNAAMDFVRANSFATCGLWTMASLKAACRLYEASGFVVAEDIDMTKWGQTAKFRRYLWTREAEA
jgi:GNAT superfamily N-acetyltransferase/DNA-binding MarR family transcriptional regulator